MSRVCRYSCTLWRPPRFLESRTVVYRRFSVPASFDSILPTFWVERLRSQGLTVPTEIQGLALPLIMPVPQGQGELLPGRSAVLQAETGTGKTICYVLPMLEHLRQQLDVDGTRVTLAGLVVVPTRELAAQVHATACALFPEGAKLVRVVAGSTALGANQETGIIISTPVALETNVHFRHLSWVRSVVLDEADMLLSGAFKQAVQGYLLARFKQRMPEDRPQHIFCGATVPSSGTKSVAAFLDRFYPPPEVLRIATPGSHRALARVTQSFIQIDSGVPLTRLELASQQLLRSRAIDELRAREVLLEATAESEALAESTEPTADTEALTDGGPAEDVENSADGGKEDASSAVDLAGAHQDVVAAEMRRRELEDEAAELRADHMDYLSRVALLRMHTLLEALLLPGRACDDAIDAHIAEGGDIAASSAIGAGTAPRLSDDPAARVQLPQRGNRASRRHSRVDVLGLSNGMPVARGRSHEVEPVAPPPPNPLPPLPSTLPLFSSLPGGVQLIKPLGVPPALRTGLSLSEIDSVPATLVFVNSTQAAMKMRKALKAAAPELA